MDADDFIRLLKDARVIFEQEPPYLLLNPDREVIIAGDTHGDVECTREIFERFPDRDYLFLGDYIDRAPTSGGSIENLTLLFEEKIRNPRLKLLRGNHEFAEVYGRYGYAAECREVFGENSGNVLLETQMTFAQLPLMVGFENGILCMHGGLPDIASTDELLLLPKSTTTVDGESRAESLVREIVWNDHAGNSGLMTTVPSDRCDGAFIYTSNRFNRVMSLLQRRVLVRGHQYATKGYGMDNKCFTVFSCRRYADYGLSGVHALSFDPQNQVDSALDLKLHYLSEK